jgi:hypothetical protein
VDVEEVSTVLSNIRVEDLVSQRGCSKTMMEMELGGLTVRMC